MFSPAGAAAAVQRRREAVDRRSGVRAGSGGIGGCAAGGRLPEPDLPLAAGAWNGGRICRGGRGTDRRRPRRPSRRSRLRRAALRAGLHCRRRGPHCRDVGHAFDRGRGRGRLAGADSGVGAAGAGFGGDRGVAAPMIPVPSGVRVWLAVGRTDMRRGMNGLAPPEFAGGDREGCAGASRRHACRCVVHRHRTTGRHEWNRTGGRGAPVIPEAQSAVHHRICQGDVPA